MVVRSYVDVYENVGAHSSTSAVNTNTDIGTTHRSS